jgi:hypothetical protein
MKPIQRLLFIAILAVNFLLAQSEINQNHISIKTFERNIDIIYKEINQTHIFNAKSCNSYISNITNFLLKESNKKLLPLTSNDLKDLKKRGDKIVKKLFLLRLRLRHKLQKLYYQGAITTECVNKIRKAFRYSRFIEEFITETLVTLDDKPIKANPCNLCRSKRQFLLNPKYKNFQFKSGDIILVRNSSFVSAIISRIGDEDGQFSHAAMMYIDKNNKKFILEALISKGAVITPFSEWRRHNLHARVALFRYAKPNAAKDAASKLHQFIERSNKHKYTIPYDFNMLPKSNEFYCSELVQYGYKLAGEEHLPTFPTSFHIISKHPFFRDLSIKAMKAFSPNDVEIEPSVDLVAEWRNYDLTREVKIEDAIQTKVLQWMSTRRYILAETLKSNLGACIGITGRHLFGLKRNDLPLNIPYGFLNNIIKIHDLDQILKKYLNKKEQEYFDKYNHSMGYLTMMNELEKFRTEDCNRYIQRQKEINDRIIKHFGDWEKPWLTPEPLFHSLFNTKNKTQCNNPIRNHLKGCKTE